MQSAIQDAFYVCFERACRLAARIIFWWLVRCIVEKIQVCEMGCNMRVHMAFTHCINGSRDSTLQFACVIAYTYMAVLRQQEKLCEMNRDNDLARKYY